MSCLIIAEIANAHEGNLEIAKEIVQAAAHAGADAVKFQVFTPEELAVPSFSYFNLYEKLQMPKESWADLIKWTRGFKLKIFADVFGPDSASLMEGQVDGLMIHAADILNKTLLKRVGLSGRQVLLSMAGSTMEDMAKGISVLKSNGNPPILLMHGFQNYPTQLPESHLRRIKTIQNQFGRSVGFASHVDGGLPEAVWLPAMAVCAGADAVEVHITMDRSKKGSDYYSSLEPEPFSKMVKLLREAELALGRKDVDLSENEIKYRQLHRKCLVALKDIQPNEVIGEHDIGLKRVNNPPSDQAANFEDAVGKTVKHLIACYSPVTINNLVIKEES